MPVGAHKPGKHSGFGGSKPPKDKSDEKKVEGKEPESPVKVKASPKPAPAEAKQKSRDGKTADQHLDELRDKVLQAGGPNVKAAGWTCKLVPSAKVEGAAASSSAPLDPCWVEPETGKEFLKRKNVLKHLGLSEPKKLTREEAAQASREKFKELNKDFPLPRKIGDVTVLQWGKVAYERPSFHSSRHIWPIGFKSRWIDGNEKDVTYESEIRDGKEQCGAPDEFKDIDAPIFVVRVTRPGEDKPTEFFGKNGKQVWRQATKDEKAKDHTGLRDEEVCTRLEGLKNAEKCQNYEFIALRPPVLPADKDAAATPKKKKKKKVSSNGDTGSKTKVAGKKRKAEGQPPRESKKTKRAREREEKLQEKAKEKEEKEKKQQAAAEERRLVKEEEARKRREAKELQEIEQKWQSRYPIEDLALELEAKAMEEAKAAGRDVPAQRAAARAVVDAVDRGWGEAAVMAAGKEAAECRANGDTDEEASEKAQLKGESVHEASTATGEVPMDVDDNSLVDDEVLWRTGTRVKVLFKLEKGTEQKYTGFVSQCPDDSNKAMIDFYDDNELIPISKDDPDLEILGQGLLRLPPSVPKPQRAPVHCADVLTVFRFVDAFRAELKLPKGTVNDLQDGLESPANSEFLNQVYQALLVSAMEATQEANQNAIVPVAWLGDNTLTNYTWPEVARRWVTCGPHAVSNKRRFPEAVLAAACLSASPGGAKSRPEGHLKLLLSLIEDSMDHPDIHSAVDRRIEVSEETKKARDEKIKQVDIELKDARERVKAAEEAVAKVDVGDEGTDVEPVPDEATKEAIEAAKALEAAKAEADGESAKATEGEAKSALRIAFEEKHAEWNKRRDERGGKAADRELTAARNKEKKLHEQKIKADTDCTAKLEKFSMRQAPLGMDRYRNKYWWFPADAATLYVEPPMPSSGKDIPDPANYSLEWRMWRGAEAMSKVAECLCDKGLRESELKAGILKIVEKLDAEQVQSTVRPQLKLQESLDDQLKFYDSFQFALQEAKNIHEVFNPEQQRILSKECPGWEEIMANPLNCDHMAQLLLNLEHAVDETMAQTKRTKRDTVASRSRADASAAPSSENGGSDADVQMPGANGVGSDLPEEWHRFSHPYINQRVRRNVMGEDLTHAGKANGVIVGYLPKEVSDFKSKQTNLDAALWKLKFDDPDIGNGYEDLEEYEVRQAILDYDKMQASLQSAASLRKGIVPGGGEAGECTTADAVAPVEEIEYDEGAIDMAEASNKVTGALWTSKMQKDAWRHEVKQGASSNSVVRMCYSASVLCENVLRVMGKTRNDLSSAPRRTRTERSKRPREVAELAAFSGFTESGRRVKKVNYAENHHDSDDSD